MMQQPQVVPPQAQAMKPVLSSNVVSSADMNKLQEMLRMMGDDQLKSLVNRPYPVGTLAGLEVSTRNRAKLAAEARAAAGSNKNIIQQDIEQLALSKMRENIANDERMGLPNVVNQMEQNPAMMAASGGMVEGYSGEDNDPLVGRDAGEELKKFKKGVVDAQGNLIVPRTMFERKLLDPISEATEFGISEKIGEGLDYVGKVLTKGTLTNEEKKYLRSLDIDPDEYASDPTKFAKKNVDEEGKFDPEKAVKENVAIGRTFTMPVSERDARQKEFGRALNIPEDKKGGLYDIGEPPTLTFPDLEVSPTDTNKFTSMLPDVENPFASRMQKGETFAQMRERERQAAGIGGLETEMRARADARADRATKAARAKNLLAFTKNVENRFSKGNQTGIQTLGNILQSATELKVGKDIAEDAGKAEQDKFLDLMAEKQIARTEGDLAKADQVDIKVSEMNANRQNERFRAVTEANRNDKTIAARMKVAGAEIEAKKAEIDLKYKELKIKGDYYQDYNQIQRLLAQNKGRVNTMKDIAALLKVSATALGDALRSGELKEKEIATVLQDILFVSNKAQAMAMFGGGAPPAIEDRPNR